MAREFDISLFSPLPERAPLVKRIVDASETTVEVTTELPLGFASAAIGLPTPGTGRRRGFIPEPVSELRGLGHCEIRVRGTGTLLHEGRVMLFSRDGFGRPDGFISVGYGGSGFAEHVFRTADEETEMTSRDIILHIMGQIAPFLRSAPAESFIDPGVIHALAEFDKMRLGEVVDQLAREGGMEPYIWDFAVWEGQRLHMGPRVPPEQPDYVADLDGAMISGWTTDFHGVYGQVTVGYENHDGDDAEFTTEPDNTFETEFGVWRTTFEEGGKLSDRGVRQFARTWQQEHRHPDEQMTITVGPNGIRRFHGGRTRPHQIRAGQWVRVPGQDEPLMITGTNYNGQADSASLSVGTGVASFADAFRRIEDLTWKQVRMINAVTGGKQRGM